MNEWMNEFFLLGERRDESTSEKSSKKKEGKGSQQKDLFIPRLG